MTAHRMLQRDSTTSHRVYVCVCVYEMEDIYTCHWGASFFEDVPLAEFMYPVFTRMPDGVTVGDAGVCFYVPFLLSASISLR